jgi:chromosome segregation ATPase
MISMYSKKKKKQIVDPNAPPRPTLLGHEKEMKVWREQFKDLTNYNVENSNNLYFLKRKVARLQSQVDALESIIRRIK